MIHSTISFKTPHFMQK